jgi:hypothetical protein
VEFGQVVPLDQAFDVFVHAAAKERREAKGPIALSFVRVKLV